MGSVKQRLETTFVVVMNFTEGRLSSYISPRPERFFFGSEIARIFVACNPMIFGVCSLAYPFHQNTRLVTWFAISSMASGLSRRGRMTALSMCQPGGGVPNRPNKMADLCMIHVSINMYNQCKYAI